MPTGFSKQLLQSSLLTLFFTAGLGGCWGSSAPEPEAKELKTDKDPLSTEAPEAELTHLSKKLYQVGMYSVARDSLASLKDRYPLGAYASFAELKHADSFFFNHEYDQAAKQYEDFLKNYPANLDAPYAKLQAARSHVASARTEGRDRQPWERALVMYDEIVQSYPNTNYAEIARQERIGVVKELSAYDREIIRFYRKRDNAAAVEDRERRFAERWGARLSEVEKEPGTSVEKSLKPLRELPPLTTSPRAVTASNVPTAVVTSTDIKGASAKSTAPAPLIEGRIVVQQVQCSKAESPFATLEVSRVPTALLAYQDSPLLLEPEGGFATVKGIELTARQLAFDCFGSKDLEITSTGDLKLASTGQITVAVLQEPPRILLTPLVRR